MNWPDLVFGPVNLWTIGPDPRYANIPALSGTTERTHRARRVAMLNRLLMQRNKH